VRIAAVHLPYVRVDLARARAVGESPTAPLAVVIARPGGAVKDEKSLLGGTRLDEVSREAEARRVRVKDTIAAARAKCAELLVRVVSEEAVRGVLQAVAEAALSFGRTSSIDETRDVVCVDITGCGHLFGENDSDGGEEALARALMQRIEVMFEGASLHRNVHKKGHEKEREKGRRQTGVVRIAVADGPRVASALACADGARTAVTVVPVGENAEAVRALPISALPIEQSSIAWLRKLGLLRIGDLQRLLPSKGLAPRLGAVHAEVMALLAGDDGAPLDAYLPPEVPEEHAELEYGIDRTEQLLFVGKRLCDRLSARLAGRAMAAARLEVVLSLDHAIARESQLPPLATLPLTFPAPLATAAELFSVVRARVESWTIPAPVLVVTLRAPELARKEGRALHLFEPEARADRALPRLVAELTANLGESRVGTLALGSSFIPEERSLLVPFARERPAAVASLTSLADEPSRFLPSPLPVSSDDPFGTPRLLARVEAVAWWRLGLVARDFLASWSERYAATAWLEVDRVSGKRQLKGWMD
jgi:protein ImuB